METANEKFKKIKKELQELWDQIEKSQEQKPKFKVGDAIVDDDCPNFFALITKVEGSKYNGEVIDTLGNFHEEFCRYFDETDRLATQKEYEDGMIKIAEAKGYKKGVQVKSVRGRNGLIKSFDLIDMCLYANTGKLLIYDKGTNQWAEIIQELEEVKPKYSIITIVHANYHYVKNDKETELICCHKNKELAQKVCDLLNKEKE